MRIQEKMRERDSAIIVNIHPRFIAFAVELPPMMRALRYVLMLIGLCVANASIADGLRCGNKLVVDGDTLDKVRTICGEPTEVSRRDILQRPSFVRDGRVYYFGNESVLVPVELWTYNFGPNKFMRRLKFVDGRLQEIETLGYGYHDSDR
jgi:hypothetical protein